MRCRSRLPGLRRFLSLAVGVCVLAWSSSASGYRPFVSTDAAVADPKEIEIELGYFTLERTKDENTFIIPRAVVNYGLFKNWEGLDDRHLPAVVLANPHRGADPRSLPPEPQRAGLHQRRIRRRYRHHPWGLRAAGQDRDRRLAY